MRSSLGFLLFGSLFALCACRHMDDEAVMPVPQACDTAVVTYSGRIVPIMQSRCALPGCHVQGGNGTGNFTTYAGVLSQVQNGNLVPAVQRTAGAIPMPPDGSMLPECDVAAIAAWVNAGALDN